MSRVVLVMPYSSNPIGGPEVVAYNILEGLIEYKKELASNNLEIIVLSNARRRKQQKYKRLFADDFIQVFYYDKMEPEGLIGDVYNLFIISARPFKQLIRSADIVHSHDIIFSLQFSFFFSRKKYFIQHVHGLPWNAIKLTYGITRKIGHAVLFLRLKLLSKIPYVNFITVSKYAKNEMRKYIGIENRRVIVIPNPIAKEFYSITKKEIPGLIFYPARIVPGKNHVTLLKAFHILKKWGLSELRLVLAGGYDNIKYFRMLKYLSYKYGLSNMVKWLGQINREKLIEMYSKASLVVTPSLEETFSLSLAEAMASGTAVVTSPKGLAIDEIIDGKNGLLIDPLNPYDIADKIRILIEDRKLKERIATEAKKTALKWRNDVVIKKLIKTWSTLIVSSSRA